MLKPLENYLSGYRQPVTEYRNEYRKFTSARPPIVRPDLQYIDNKQSMPMQSETTNRKDYVRHPVKKIEVPPPIYFRAPYKMETSSSYTDTYTNKLSDQPLRYDINRPDGSGLEARPFTANATYKTDYQKWNLTDKRKPYKADQWIPANDDFKTLDSTYGNDFKKHSVKPMPTVRTDLCVPRLGVPFSNEQDTGYVQEYKDYGLSKFFFVPRKEKFWFKTNKRFFKPQDIQINKANNTISQKDLRVKKRRSRTSFDKANHVSQSVDNLASDGGAASDRELYDMDSHLNNENADFSRVPRISKSVYTRPETTYMEAYRDRSRIGNRKLKLENLLVYK